MNDATRKTGPVSITIFPPYGGSIGGFPDPGRPGSPMIPPIAVAVGPAWDAHIAQLRTRSYELAVERGHLRRG